MQLLDLGFEMSVTLCVPSPSDLLDGLGPLLTMC